ncbi:hypothetical protein QBC39DRAFT_269230 [Podospora conica]|nr:hypothetical protein QBC39DRAFT_269230 [Schizothecium conicum]
MARHGTSPLLEIPQTPRKKRRSQDGDDGDVIDHLDYMDDLQGKKTTGSSHLVPMGLRSRSASPLPRHGMVSPARLAGPTTSTYPPGPRILTAKRSWGRFWSRNRGVILVGCAQVFGALMNLSARLLELDGEGMHPFQILFFRMSITTVCSVLYMWYTKVPHFPLGAREVRGLLVARGLSGFFGIYGMWYVWSMMYLPLAESTVIAFLAPAIAGYICYLFLGYPYSVKERIATFIALAGVILIARPTSLFGSHPSPAPVVSPSNSTTTATPHLLPGQDPTPAQRLVGIGIALIGVAGASGAYVTIKWIGSRAHPLISVTYFSVWSTVVSTTALLLAPLLKINQPALRFALPASGYQWGLLTALGVCGFVMQFMMTAGLGGEKGNRATAMLYTHMLFAAGFDRWVFGVRMGVVSLAGCGLIVGSALWAALSKKEEGERRKEGGLEEGVPMLGVGGDVGGVEEEGEEGGRW